MKTNTKHYALEIKINFPYSDKQTKNSRKQDEHNTHKKKQEQAYTYKWKQERGWRIQKRTMDHNVRMYRRWNTLEKLKNTY